MCTVQFDRTSLHRAAVKYGTALEHIGAMGRHIAKTMGARPFEIEVSLDETDEPTSLLEHLFIAMELKRHKVPNVVSVAPRFIGDFEKGIDYKGDVKKFEKALVQHAAISKRLHDGVIFDLDGVVTQTAAVHAAAWHEAEEQREAA